MEAVVDRLRRGAGHHGGQLLHVRLLHGGDGSEVLQEFFLPRLAHAGDVVQLRALGGLGVLLVVVGDGEAMYLLLHRADQGEQSGRLPDAQLLPPGGDQGAGAVPVVLHHAQHRHVQTQPGHHLLGDAGMVFAAVDQQQVG